MPPSPTKSNFSTPSRTSFYPDSNDAINTQTFQNDYSTFEHISPTKALYQSRLNNDITSLTAWLETLHAPNPIPKTFLGWRDEVYQASQFNVGVLGPGAGVAPSSFSHFAANASGSGADVVSHSDDDGSKILEALKTLKQANLLADHLRSLVAEAKVEELDRLEREKTYIDRQREGNVPSRVLMDEIYAGLGPNAQNAVEELEKSAVLLQISLKDQRPEDEERSEGKSRESGLMSLYSRRALQEAYRQLVLEDQIEDLRMLFQRIWSQADSNEMAANLKRRTDPSTRAKITKSVNAEVIDEDDGGHEDNRVQAETTRFVRDTKQINLKILEYQDRITSLHRQLSRLRTESLSLSDVLNMRKRVQERLKNIEDLERRINAFHGLAPDLTASRNEIKRAAVELEEYRKKREDLFGRISNVER